MQGNRIDGMYMPDNNDKFYNYFYNEHNHNYNFDDYNNNCIMPY